MRQLGAGLAALAVVLAVTVVLTTLRGSPPKTPSPTLGQSVPAAAATPAPTPTDLPLPVNPPPADLPVIDYGPAPSGFPPDPAPESTVRLSEGLRPISRVGAYDAPGGRARAYLAPTIRGVEITLPVVERRSGWAGVLLPSANRTMAWLPPGGWTTVALRDHIVVVRTTHQLHWFRDDALVRSWPVTLGAAATPTPLGRSFILGRSALPGRVYAGTDVFALGAVPDEPDSVPAGLRGAHIGLHTWYHDGELGEDTTDGCIRLTRAGQQLLLTEIAPGTEVLVVDAPTGVA